MNSVRESGGNALLTLKMTGRRSTIASVHLTTSDGTAQAGSDYRRLSRDITFSPGGSMTQTIGIPILNDRKAESDETFTVTLT